MKKIVTLLFLVSSILVYSQQVDRQTVIVEVGTGTWCPSCPAVVEIIHTLIDNGANIAVVEYHINDPYQNSGSTIRGNYYDFPWYPTTYYDSNHIGYDDWATYSVHLAYYEDRLNTPSSFSVDLIDGFIDDSGSETLVKGTVTIEKLAEYDGENIVLHVVLTESDIPEEWQGLTELDHVERLMFPNGNGTPIDFSSNSSQSIAFEFLMEETWLVENSEIVYFIQDNDTKEILQADKIGVEQILSNGEDLNQAKNAYFYPNPAQREIFLNDNNQTVSNIVMFNILGEKTMEIGEYNTSINIENLPQGIYLLSYEENGTKKMTKIIKK